MKQQQTKKLTLMAALTAISIIVGFIEIPWPAAPFLKIDFSEVVILISLLFLGFPRTIVIVILRSLLRQILLPKGGEAPFIGEFMAIYSSFALMIFYQLITGVTKTKLSCILDHNKNVRCLTEDDPAFFISTDKPKFRLEPFKYQNPPIWKHILHVSFVVVMFTIMLVSFNFFFAIPINLSYTGSAENTHFFFTSFVKDPNFFFFTKGNIGLYLKEILVLLVPFNLVKSLVVMIAFELTKIGIMRLDISRL